MAKEQWHNWGRTLLIVVGIVFAAGGYVMKVRGNTSAIAKVENEVKVAEDDIVGLKLQYKDIERLSENIGNSLGRIEAGQRTFHQDLKEQRALRQAMATDIAVITVKVNTLTKE